VVVDQHNPVAGCGFTGKRCCCWLHGIPLSV
jgi:hypothetical protein